jgi:DNA polymerase-4
MSLTTGTNSDYDEVAPSIVAHVDIDCFFAAAEILRRPELKDRPVAIGSRAARGVVATANYVARKYGVHSAMAMSTARKLCPALVIIPPDFSWYKDLSYQVMAVLTELSVSISPGGLDEAYLELPPSTSFESAPGAAENIRSLVLLRTGLVVSVGIAPTKYAAKLASDAAKPDGFKVVTPENFKNFIYATPLSKIPGLGSATRAKLSDAGINSTKAMAALEFNALSAIVGNSSATYLYAVCNATEAPQTSSSNSTSIGSEETLSVDVHTLGEFRSNVSKMATETLRRLHHAGVGARGVTLKIKTSDFKEYSRSKAFTSASNNDVVILNALATLIEPTFALAKGHIRLVGVTLTNLTNTVQLRLDLEATGYTSPDIHPVPPVGARVTHKVFGDGVINQ